MKLFGAAILLAFLLSNPASGSENFTSSVRIVSGDWHPYSHPDQVTDSEAHVNNLLDLDNVHPSWHYPGFDFALEQLRRGQAELAFPFFYAPAREKEFVYSAPLFEVQNIVIYNRRNQALTELLEQQTVNTASSLVEQGMRFGIVSGYSYLGLFGDDIPEDSRSFGSERHALAALLAGDIDVLPIAEPVWQSLQLRHYPDRYHLVRRVQGLSWKEGLFLLALDNPAGRELIESFNLLLEQFPFQTDGLDLDHSTISMIEEINRGTVRLQSTPLQPLILGHPISNEAEQVTLVIPDGTSALVLEWAEAYFDRDEARSVVQLMKARTRALLLNGPHAGRTVLVENAHIEIR